LTISIRLRIYCPHLRSSPKARPICLAETAIAALGAGATAVVASAHPLYGAKVARFAEVLHTCLLDYGCCLGDALQDDPLHWATTVLWGTPLVRLR
jgi:hypothetical protein